MNAPTFEIGNTEGRYFTIERFERLREVGENLFREFGIDKFKLNYDPNEDYHELHWDWFGRQFVAKYYKVLTVSIDGVRQDAVSAVPTTRWDDIPRYMRKAAWHIPPLDPEELTLLTTNNYAAFAYALGKATERGERIPAFLVTNQYARKQYYDDLVADLLAKAPGVTYERIVEALESNILPGYYAWLRHEWLLKKERENGNPTAFFFYVDPADLPGNGCRNGTCSI